MQRKKTPELRALPLLMQSNCRMKSSNFFSVCKSPGPFLTFSQPSLVTDHLDALRLGSLKTFQPVRFLPLNNAVEPSGRIRIERSVNWLPGGTANWTEAGLAGFASNGLFHASLCLLFSN